MREYLKGRSEIFGALLLFVIGVFNKEIFGDISVVYTVLLFLFALIAWDFIKSVIFNYEIYPVPKWLYYSSENKKAAFPFRSIHKSEENVPAGTTIYLVTPNLLLDISNPATIETVKINLSRGINYIFITSDDAESIKKVEKLKRIHIDNVKNLAFYVVSMRLIQALSSDNIMIYSLPASQNRGFIQIPDGTGRWWAEMSSEATEIYYTGIKVSLPQFTSL